LSPTGYDANFLRKNSSLSAVKSISSPTGYDANFLRKNSSLSAVKSISSLAGKIGNYKAMKSCFLNGLLGQAPSRAISQRRKIFAVK